ncbi:acyltransferase [Desulfopila inferna]|uniref:acyltransferase n=1 Tax=Desulfopila inferna TaxID=468528 RepID=UPI0019654C33|nr:acyltransferase [Desulfopila inferna]MBM9605175.1 acyltransferase [Desulfopila inferna]
MKILKEIWRAMWSSWERSLFLYALVRNLPGQYGFQLRKCLLIGKFGSTGTNIKIHEGFRFRQIHKIYLGDYINIGVDCFIQASGSLEIGDYTIIGPGVKIWTQNHITDSTDIPIQKQGTEYKKIIIGRDCWIGSNAFIMPGTVLGDGTVVSAGAVVGAKKYPPFAILAGNPARVIGIRTNDPHHNRN